MEATDNQTIERFDEALESWTDERFVTRKQLRALAMFNMYLVNISEAQGWEYDGQSLKIGAPMSCLVVKATIEGVPHVVFSSASTPTGCVVTFMRKLELGLLEWRPDKFRH